MLAAEPRPTLRARFPAALQLFLCRFIEIEHPVDPELICEHGEAGSPESFLQRLHDLAFGGERAKYLLDLRHAFAVQCDKEITALLKRHARHVVRCHEHGRPFLQPGMHDAVFSFFRNIAAGRLRERQHVQVRAKALLVKSHGFTAISVKDQIRIDFFHHQLLKREIRVFSRLRECRFSAESPRAAMGSADLSIEAYVPNLSAALALALAASSSRFLGGAVVSSERSSRFEMAAISSIAVRNAASLAFEGLLKPVIFLTNWSEAA